ncbi:Hypothetical predicted protein [Pelobates cultripes]|uniref:Uncharacterized protein n=1 Tax=Pelobates cultripes TaxID=61616 RepID=A0AAD1SEC8_PELCU|nr:Hypothetical predicted protein [Pelobates cultripes]
MAAYNYRNKAEATRDVLVRFLLNRDKTAVQEAMKNKTPYRFEQMHLLYLQIHIGLEKVPSESHPNSMFSRSQIQVGSLTDLTSHQRRPHLPTHLLQMLEVSRVAHGTLPKSYHSSQELLLIPAEAREATQ